MGETSQTDGVETVTISARELEDLRGDAQKLSALEAAGVDNWEGYGNAMEILREWEGDTGE